MVEAMIFMHSLHGHDIPGIFYHQDRLAVTTLIGTDDAELAVRDIATSRAEAQIAFDLNQGLGELGHVGFFHVKDIEGQPSRCLGSNTR